MAPFVVCMGVDYFFPEEDLEAPELLDTEPLLELLDTEPLLELLDTEPLLELLDGVE